MGPDRSEVTLQLTRAMEAARTLRDEIRLNLHLASMDAVDKWREIEPELTAAERQLARGVRTLSHETVEDLVRQLRNLRAAIPAARTH